MPINFRLANLEITDFRGIDELELDFRPGSCHVLIGANNSGKSTVLDALALCLGGPSAYNFTPDEFDFHTEQDGLQSSSFDISVTFKAAAVLELPAVRAAYGDPVSVHGARVQGSRDKSGKLSHDVRLFGADGKAITLATSLPLQGKAKELWKEHDLSFSKRNARWSDIRDHKPEVWMLRPNNLYQSLYQWKTGPLQRLAGLLAERFFSTKWDFNFEGKLRPMPKTLESAHRFLTAAIREFPFWRDDLRPKLEATLSEYVGRQAKIELKPAIEAIQDWLRDQLVLSLAADAGGFPTPLEKMGQGWQSLVRIAALDVLSQYPGEAAERVVLLFEEPESFLHPHMARKLRGVLDKLASAGWFVVLTTHSPNLVSFAGKQSIFRLTRDGSSINSRTLHVDELDGAARFQDRLDERGAHEMLFAQKAVLCEGQDDVFAVRTFLQRHTAIDLDGRSISIVRVGDVKQIPAFAAMATKLGIPWVALTDEDRSKRGEPNPSTEAVRAKLAAMASPTDGQVFWPGSLEAASGLTTGKATPEWQDRALWVKDATALKLENADLFATCSAISAWLDELPGGPLDAHTL